MLRFFAVHITNQDSSLALGMTVKGLERHFCRSNLFSVGLSSIKACCCCDTPQGLKPCSFCLSRVVGALRNAAWLRLGEYLSSQGKARKERIHACRCFLGSSRERLPLVGVTRHPLAEPDVRVSRYPALPLRFAEDVLYQGAYQHGASGDRAYRG